ncbi:EamA family transporter [Chitinophaga eiseniae]|uniref:EamA family transporter n=1 Tax=Chitinophaga eiseniae TaxID=634771 RepID=A0A847SBJ2_9BACT|nr:EamA family transporter [Chitinophaga eiseniae]NLR80570.1 EamA family transporter [Chitinophaga eiseniae]
MTRYIFMVFAGACSFGILSTFVKLAYREGYAAAEISVTQAFTGMLVLWVLTFIYQRSKEKLSGRDWRWLLFTGATIGLTSFVYYVSVAYIPASIAIILLMQFTWIGLLLDWIIFGKRPSGLQWLTAGLILLGTWLASGLASGRMEALSVKGLAYAGASAVLYAIYVIANSRVAKQLHPLRKSAIIMTGSTMGVLLVNASALAVSTHFNVGLIKWALFLSLFGTIIPPLLFARGIPKVGAGISAVIMTAELPVAIICSHLLLAEPVNGVQWAGVVVMLLAMLLLNAHYFRR